jgi:hypothetical protein
VKFILVFVSQYSPLFIVFDSASTTSVRSFFSDGWPQLNIDPSWSCMLASDFSCLTSTLSFCSARLSSLMLVAEGLEHDARRLAVEVLCDISFVVVVVVVAVVVPVVVVAVSDGSSVGLLSLSVDRRRWG